MRARYVGTVKRAQVLPLVLADADLARAEKQAAQDVLDAGRWVEIPRGNNGLVSAMHPRAGALGGVWDSKGFRYALPSDEARAALQQAVGDWLAAAQAERDRTEAQRAERRARDAEDRTRQAAEEKEAAAAEAQRCRAKAIADSGRTLTGDTETRHTISTRFLNQATANSQAWPVGSVHRIHNGQRGLVVERWVWFTNADDATDVDWHADAPDEAHWNFRYTLVGVEPTERERRADAETAAVRVDAAAIRGLFHELTHVGRVVDRFTMVPEADRAGTIEGTAGTPGVSPHGVGTLILTTDDRVVWHHPGFYDDYTATEAVITDPDQVIRVRALIDAGPRTRHVHDQLTYTYEVVIPTVSAVTA